MIYNLVVCVIAASVLALSLVINGLAVTLVTHLYALSTVPLLLASSR